MSFSPQALLESLDSLPKPSAYCIALSGGLDSMVLLDALARLSDALCAPLSAIHIHHGLQDEADRWAAHCRAQCDARSVPLQVRHARVERSAGLSLEAAAREARYAAIERLLPVDGLLLTAHHLDDQAETLLLQLLRGAGPAGLAGAASLRALGPGWLARPLLNTPRHGLHDYALARDLHWVEDPSNADTGFDRNHLRHSVLPLLRQRWPGADAALARSARHCGEAQQVLDEVAAELFAVHPDNAIYRLDVDSLLQLSEARQRLVMRHWLRLSRLPVADTNRLQRVLGEVARARPDGKPCVSWPGAEVRRFRGRLYAMPPLGAEPQPQRLEWGMQGCLSLPAGLGELCWIEDEGACCEQDPGSAGVSLPRSVVAASRIQVALGERPDSAVPAGRQGRRRFSRLCQDWRIPYWMRRRVPLLYIDGQLAAVADYGALEPFGCSADTDTLTLSWRRPGYLK